MDSFFRSLATAASTSFQLVEMVTPYHFRLQARVNSGREGATVTRRIGGAAARSLLAHLSTTPLSSITFLTGLPTHDEKRKTLVDTLQQILLAPQLDTSGES